MSSFRIRPGFTQIVDLGIEETRARIARTVNEESERCEILSFPGFMCLRIPSRERKFWSPRLHLSLEPTEDGKTRVQGTYGPNANMWSAFLYGFLFVGSLSVFSGIFGFCQWMIGQTPWGLWIFLTVLGIVIALYLLAQLGQKLGARQTFQLHQIYESAMGATVEIH